MDGCFGWNDLEHRKKTMGILSEPQKYFIKSHHLCLDQIGFAVPACLLFTPGYS